MTNPLFRCYKNNQLAVSLPNICCPKLPMEICTSDNLNALIDDIMNTRKLLTSTSMDNAPVSDTATGKVNMPANATSTGIINGMDDTPASNTATGNVNILVNATSIGMDEALGSDAATGKVNMCVNATSIGMEDTPASDAATGEDTTPALKDPSEHIAELTTSTSQAGEKKTGTKAENLC